MRCKSGGRICLGITVSIAVHERKRRANSGENCMDDFCASRIGTPPRSATDGKKLKYWNMLFAATAAIASPLTTQV
jgi:hypothetical protein